MRLSYATYLNDHGLPKAVPALLCQEKYLTTLSTRIQLSSIDLHYRAKYFWHLTKISNIKEQHIPTITDRIQQAIVTEIKSTLAVGCLTLALSHSGLLGLVYIREDNSCP